MIKLIQNLFYPSSDAPYHPKSSGLTEIIQILALSILALVVAKVYERKAPGVAFIFRFIPFGLSFLWLLSRCGVSSKPHKRHHVVYDPPISTYSPRRDTDSSWFKSEPTLYEVPKSRGYKAPKPFKLKPHTMPSPFPKTVPQPYTVPHVVPVYSPPSGGFPKVVPVPTFPTVVRPPVYEGSYTPPCSGSYSSPYTSSPFPRMDDLDDKPLFEVADHR